jgi:hypothetical protein
VARNLCGHRGRPAATQAPPVAVRRRAAWLPAAGMAAAVALVAVGVLIGRNSPRHRHPADADPRSRVLRP